MIDLFLKNNPGFNLLIAPPAWGKTQILKKLFRGEGKFIFISPLRALANEFFLDLSTEFSVGNIEKMSDWKIISSQRILIVTPELIQDLSLVDDEFTIIFDEFHLYFYWGISFREEMWRVLVELCSSHRKIIGLTATMSNSNLTMMREQFIACDFPITIVDLGNQKLKNIPRKIHYLPTISKNSWKYFLQPKGSKDHCTLVFCEYRKQVLNLEKELREKELTVISCVGGGAAEFINQLQNNPNPQFIISTTVLSHGVNLPAIDQIIFTYPVENVDFWIQMVGRGGRKGECFTVVSYDKFFANRWLKFTSFFTLGRAYINYHLSWD